MGPVEALKIALSKEESSVELYTRLSTQAPAARDILLFLIEEEQKHKHLIDKKIAELTT